MPQRTSTSLIRYSCSTIRCTIHSSKNNLNRSTAGDLRSRETQSQSSPPIAMLMQLLSWKFPVFANLESMLHDEILLVLVARLFHVFFFRVPASSGVECLALVWHHLLLAMFGDDKVGLPPH